MQIFDPLTGDANGNNRQPFANNVIPANRLNPVAVKILSYVPNPTRDVSNGSNNHDSIGEINDRAIMYTGKMDHRFSDKVSLAGFYLYNKTDEPCANALVPQGEPNAFIDTDDYVLRRRVHVLALNNTWLPGNNTVFTLRYGWTKFQDQNTLSVEYDPAQLGFAQSFLSPLQVKKFPQITTLTDYRVLGAIDPNRLFWNSWSANGTMSKLRRQPHLQGRRRLPQHRRRHAVVRGRRRALRLHAPVHLVQPVDDQRDVRQRAGQHAAGLSGCERRFAQHGDRVEPVPGLDQLLRRLRAGRLARQLQVHVELRPPPRA